MGVVAGERAGARRHGAVLDEAIRQAVRDELDAHGFAGLTFEGVARRARTSKPVIYRRYDSRSAMVIDVWLRDSPDPDESFVSSGELRADLIAVARAFAERFEHIGGETLRGLLAQSEPAQIERLSAPSEWVLEAMQTLLDAARARGEITRVDFPSRVHGLPITLVRHEVIFTGSFGEQALTEIIDMVWMPLLVASP